MISAFVQFGQVQVQLYVGSLCRSGGGERRARIYRLTRGQRSIAANRLRIRTTEVTAAFLAPVPSQTAAKMHCQLRVILKLK